MTDFLLAAASAAGGRELFHRSSDSKGASIRHLALIPLAESTKLCLLVVTADGRRVYFSTQHLSRYLPGDGDWGRPQPRPQTLMAVFARPALPHAGITIGRVTADLTRTAAGGLEVVTAHYSSGCLLLAEAAGHDGRSTSLIVASRSPARSLPGMATAVQYNSNVPGLLEVVAELEGQVPGEACSIAAAGEAQPAEGLLGPELLPRRADDLAAAIGIYSAPPRFVLISTAGVVQLEQRRPVDVLEQILQGGSAQQLADFFEVYGATEAAAMCYSLATARSGAVGPGVAQAAWAALKNTQLVKEPELPGEGGAGTLQAAMGDAGTGAAGGGMAGAGTSASGAAGGGGGGGYLGARGGEIYMGQAVNPNPEPRWSAAHKGLCLYVSRLLAPVWTARLVGPAPHNTSVLQCRLSTATLEVVEAKLRGLDAFLGAYIRDRQAAGYNSSYSRVAGQAASTSAGGGLQLMNEDVAVQLLAQAAKRQRVANAAAMEDERAGRLRALVSRTAQALVLLRLLAANNLGRLAARLDDRQRRLLRDLALRDLVYDADGEALASSLINQLLTDHIDARGAVGEELAAQLQSLCPSYFKEADRVYYQAAAKLKNAESAATPGERDVLAAAGVALLLRVPQVVDLSALTAQLAALGQYGGAVQLVLRAAAVADPQGLAGKPQVGPDHERASQARANCYGHALRLLGAALKPADDAAGSPLASLSPGERSAAKSALLKAAASSSDVLFHRALYSFLLDAAPGELLGLNTPHLEGWLRSEGGLPAQPVAPSLVGPLKRRQVAALQLLAKLYVARQRGADAAAVHAVLAQRKGGAGDAAVTLDERVSELQAAVLAAKSVGDAALVDAMDSAHRVMRFQQATAARLKRRLSSAEATADADADQKAKLQRLLDDVSEGVKDISDLYNNYAQPLALWDICLRLCHFAAGQVDALLVRQLWDLQILQTWEAARGTGGAADGVAAMALLEDAYGAVAASVAELGSEFYPSDEASLPLAHVAARLEQLAAGLWPEGGRAAPEPLAVGDTGVRALLEACRGSVAAVQRVYDALLAHRALGISDAELATPQLKTQLLRSLTHICRAALSELDSSLLPPPGAAPYGAALRAAGAVAAAGPYGALGRSRDAILLADACSKYAAEARRLGSPEGEVLAGQFDAVRQQLELLRTVGF